jgi:hypothetical protein
MFANPFSPMPTIHPLSADERNSLKPRKTLIGRFLGVG